MKSDIPSRGTSFKWSLGLLETLFTSETFYRQYATPNSSVQGQRGPTAATAVDFQFF